MWFISTPTLTSRPDGLSLLHSSWLHHLERCRALAAIVQVAVPEQPVPAWVGGRLTRIGRAGLEADVSRAVDRILQALDAGGVETVYISVDIDVVDASEAPATGLPDPTGLPSATVVELIEEIGRRATISGADLVETAPPLSGTRNWRDEATCVTGARITDALTAAMSEPALRRPESARSSPG